MSASPCRACEISYPTRVSPLRTPSVARSTDSPCPGSRAPPPRCPQGRRHLVHRSAQLGQGPPDVPVGVLHRGPARVRGGPERRQERAHLGLELRHRLLQLTGELLHGGGSCRTSPSLRPGPAAPAGRDAGRTCGPPRGARPGSARRAPARGTGQGGRPARRRSAPTGTRAPTAPSGGPPSDAGAWSGWWGSRGCWVTRDQGHGRVGTGDQGHVELAGHHALERELRAQPLPHVLADGLPHIAARFQSLVLWLRSSTPKTAIRVWPTSVRSRLPHRAARPDRRQAPRWRAR